MITILILRLSVGIVATIILCYWMLSLYSKNHKLDEVKELWKSLALALEVQLESVQDYYTRVDGEGCMTRSKRRHKDIVESDNAEGLAYDARETLMDMGEYE